jgi:mRNA interferase YafQ
VKYDIIPLTSYAKDVKRLRKRKFDLSLLDKIIRDLADDIPLGPKHKDHPLKGGYAGWRDCHVQDDWALVYRKEKNMLLLLLSRTGTHSDLKL